MKPSATYGELWSGGTARITAPGRAIQRELVIAEKNKPGEIAPEVNSFRRSKEHVTAERRLRLRANGSQRQRPEGAMDERLASVPRQAREYSARMDQRVRCREVVTGRMMLIRRQTTRLLAGP